MLGKRGRGDGMSRARCRFGHGMECEGRGGGGSARLEGEGLFETHAKRNGKRRNSDGTLLTIAWFAFSPVGSLLGPRSFLSFHKLPTGHRPPSARARGIRTLSASAPEKVVFSYPSVPALPSDPYPPLRPLSMWDRPTSTCCSS